jgi:Flp pilus assembly protein TadG
MVLHRPGGRSRGQSMVECALVLPVFLMLVFGTVDLGRAIFYQSLLNEAVRDGARYGLVSQDTATVQQHVQTGLNQFAGAVTTCSAVIYSTVLLTAAPACANAGSAAAGAYGYVTVTATLPFSPIVGLYSTGWQITLRAQSTMIFSP